MSNAPQPSLFDDAAAPAVLPAPADAVLQALADDAQARWGGRLHLGTSSWHFPGWAAQVWRRPYPEALLSRNGLQAYAQHPLLRCVSLDRAFYRVLQAGDYAALAAQVPADFRFVVKAPALLTDAQRRDAGSAAPQGDNPLFLDPGLAARDVAVPAAQGLGVRLGVLVLQLSPLPAHWLREPERLHARLAGALQAMQDALADGAPQALVAVELRDPSLLTPALAALLRRHGVRFALGLHDRMPPVGEQLPMLRATWPGVWCALDPAAARPARAPPPRPLRLTTRSALVRVMRATLQAGHRVFVTINNKAEGSAPASVRALAEALLAPPGG